MAELRFTNKAVADLTSIWQYTFNTWSERQADEYYKLLIAACRKTLATPLAKPYDEIAPELYGIKAGHHIIFFKRITNEEVLIVRILHERMDVNIHFNETDLN